MGNYKSHIRFNPVLGEETTQSTPSCVCGLYLSDAIKLQWFRRAKTTPMSKLKTYQYKLDGIEYLLTTIDKPVTTTDGHINRWSWLIYVNGNTCVEHMDGYLNISDAFGGLVQYLDYSVINNQYY